MEKKISAAIIAAVTLFVLALMPAAYAADQGQTGAMTTEKAAMPAMNPAPMKAAPMTVTGMIVANKNKQGKIVGYALQEEGGQSLMLSRHGKGMELRKMVGSKVEATGTVQEAKGAKTITVQEFKKIE